MEAPRVVLEQFKNSEFYKKYENTYYGDIIIRETFGCDVKLHGLYGINSKKYGEIHQMNIDVMQDLLDLFVNKANVNDNEILWNMVYSFYIDPDSNGVKELNGIKCTADGLFSIRRIFKKYGMSQKTISEYARYRKVPIFFFSQEKNGINMTRASVFGDRIDYTLFDLKQYFDKGGEGKSEMCKMISAYQLPKTSEWLDSMGSFEKLVEWYGIKGIFVDDNYEVFDIEKGDGSLITEYKKDYSWLWSDAYYDNLRLLVDKFMKANNQ